ncbi:sigma-70 family RNA polymerase sigma factor, partial [Frankia sp. Mgl5]|uniref:sigma-70 family RNA polymerase sigma factor n=1 Tax=Frankia sp. Mgl5 TaxID=2933793 RepID=UPI00200D3FA3
VNNRFGDEEKLLAELGNRTPAAFERFYERYVPLVFQIALRMVGDRMEAEDLCQEIFLEAYRTVHQYDPERGSVEAWLAVKTRARCLDRLRRKKTELFGGFDQLERQPGP